MNSTQIKFQKHIEQVKAQRAKANATPRTSNLDLNQYVINNIQNHLDPVPVALQAARNNRINH
jgi:hypothetical protein